MGNTIIDHVISVEKLPDDGKVWVESKQKFVGGQGANAAQGMAKLGLDVAWLSRLGDDDDGHNALRHFKSCGIDTSLCIEVARAHTMSAIVTIGRECMKRCCYMHKDERLLEYDISSHICNIDVQAFEVLYTDGHQTDLALPVVQKATARGVPVIADIEVLDQDCRALAKLASHVIAPLEVLQELSGEADPERAVRALSDVEGKTVIATAGLDGSYGTSFEDQNVHHVKVRPECQAFDTLGAGDAYHAGLLAEWSSDPALGAVKASKEGLKEPWRRSGEGQEGLKEPWSREGIFYLLVLQGAVKA
ncbi:rbsK [Symbiodinium natans]|uniref:RbsK protein n=1 Tax=Symbiodinium natans TaxID=878477 RepID=A0A812RTX3_9DINO|nr:rbsK [Symbiodinium natans]